VQDVGTCQYNGEVIRYNASADIILALEASRPHKGCEVYLPTGIYHIAGCGQKLAGSNNSCPVLRAPYDTQVVRTIQILGGKTICGEGMDADGSFEPTDNLQNQGAGGNNNGVPPANGGIHQPARWGTYLVGALGSTTQTLGTEILTTNHNDQNGDAVARSDGVSPSTILTGINAVNPNRCHAMSNTDPRCDVKQSAAKLGISVGQAWGRVITTIGDASNIAEICVDNALASTGTCQGDRRIICDTNAGLRTGADTGSCDFGVGGNFGPCQTTTEALTYETKTKMHQNMSMGVTSPIDNFDGTIVIGTATGWGVPGKNSSFTVCNATGALVSWGNRDIIGGAGSQTTWPPWSSVWTQALMGTQSLIIARNGDLMAMDTSVQDLSFMKQGYFGREGNDSNKDLTSTGLATAGAALTLTSAAAGWTVDAFKGMTVILRPSALSVLEGCAANCREARAISTNSATVLTQQINWVTNPAVNDPFRISNQSCPYVTNATVGGAVACDSNFSMTPGALGGSVIDRVAFNNAGDVDGFTYWVDPMPIIQNSIMQDNRTYFTSDSGPVIWKHDLFRNNTVQSGALISPGYGRGGVVEDSTFLSNNGSMIGAGPGRHGRILRNVFSGNFTVGQGVISLQSSEISDNMIIEKNQFIGNVGPSIKINLGAGRIDGLVIRDNYTSSEAQNNSPLDSGGGFAALVFQGFAPLTGQITNAIVENFEVRVNYAGGANGPCAVFIDNRGTMGTNFGGVVFRNIVGRNLAGGANVILPICTADLSAAKQAQNDLGLRSLAFPPIVQSAVTYYGANTRQTPDQPYRYQPTTSLVSKICTAARAGEVVAITDDITAAGTCAGGATLTGGGALKSICKCNGVGTAWAPL
jgi:hypothetical protein